ncbi:Uncharacterised protein [Segatella copri]|nr:Uncharacterised protein [Segatella copri]
MSVEQDVAIQQFHVIVIAWLQDLFSLSVHYRHLSIRKLDDGKLPSTVHKLTILYRLEQFFMAHHHHHF